MGVYFMMLDEDCLYFDIWLFVVLDVVVFVLVFLYGGVFMIGGGLLFCYDGVLFVRNSGCVVVNVIYCFGLFGFLF